MNEKGEKTNLKFNLINIRYYLLDMQGCNSALTILKPLSFFEVRSRSSYWFQKSPLRPQAVARGS